MNSLLTTIKSEQVQARKEKDEVKASILTTLIGEASMIGKNAGNRETTDSEAIQVITKFVKNINETLSFLEKEKDKNSDQIQKLQYEEKILSAYLPKKMTEEELRVEMKKIVESKSLSGPKSMGILMKSLKESFEGMYDGATASKIAKEVLS